MRGAAPRVPGFRAAGVRCGVKPDGPDLALVVSEGPATAAGVFTRSSVVGAPVVVSREHVRRGRARAIVANSGVANVGLGARGLRDANAVVAASARVVGCAPEEVLVASTGVIGVPLPVARLRDALPRAAAALSPEGFGTAARAIMTTDTVPKWASARLRVGGALVTVGGMAKGAGMIEPHLATMLGFLLTDAAVAAPALRRLLRAACEQTFNRLSVDGETSTSDTVLLLANGRAGTAPIRDPRSREGRALAKALREVCGELARAIARDGEGATKLVTVRVTGARSAAEAERAARRVANSPLVKTALFGGDPNWGRVLQTIGAARVGLDLERVEVRLAGVAVFRRGSATGPAARRRAGAGLAKPEVEVAVDLGVGRGAARIWSCDLSPEYVRINAEYST